MLWDLITYPGEYAPGPGVLLRGAGMLNFAPIDQHFEEFHWLNEATFGASCEDRDKKFCFPS